MPGFDYSKWDHIELSDDEEDLHPNIDKESLTILFFAFLDRAFSRNRFLDNVSLLAGGRCPPDCFFSAPLTTRAPPTTVQPDVRSRTPGRTSGHDEIHYQEKQEQSAHACTHVLSWKKETLQHHLIQNMKEIDTGKWITIVFVTGPMCQFCLALEQQTDLHVFLCFMYILKMQCTYAGTEF